MKSLHKTIAVFSAAIVAFVAVFFAFCPNMPLQMEAKAAVHAERGNCDENSGNSAAATEQGCNNLHLETLTAVSRGVIQFSSVSLLALSLLFLVFAVKDLFREDAVYFEKIKNYVNFSPPFVDLKFNRWFSVLNSKDFAWSL